MRAVGTQSHFALIVFYFAIAVWALPEWLGAFSQRPEKGPVHDDRGSHAFLWVNLPTGIVAASDDVNQHPGTTIVWQQRAIFWADIGLMLAGVGFRSYAIGVLGRYFTHAVALLIVMLLFVLGALFGGVVLTRGSWLTLAIVLIVGTLPFSALGLAVGMRVSDQASAALINLIYLPMSFLSGLWVPLRFFPQRCGGCQACGSTLRYLCRGAPHGPCLVHVATRRQNTQYPPVYSVR